MGRVVTLIPGDGIGPEVTEAAVRVVEALGVEIDWDVQRAGADAAGEDGDPLPGEVVDSIVTNRVALKGPITTPIGRGFQSVNVRLRRALDLYANLRPVQSLPRAGERYEDVDLIVVRENTEGLYSGIEHQVIPGVVESLKIITEKASTRIAEYAFEYARSRRRKKVTAVHKANIMKMSDGLFLRCFREVANGYQDIEADERIVDNMAMQLVLQPQRYDVLVLPNLYGDILSDLCAGLVGGLGVVPGANHGTDCAVFEAVHGSAPDIAGQNVANPTALIRSALLMLEHLGLDEEAERGRRALTEQLVAGESLTRDLGGDATTQQFTTRLVEKIADAD